MHTKTEHTHTYEVIEKAIKFLYDSLPSQPSLKEVAAYVGMSEFHFQRLFSQWAGVSPKKFMEFLSVERLKKELSAGATIAEAADNAGLSSQSHAYDLFVSIEAVSPGEYRQGGQGIVIEYGFADTPFGECCIASTKRGVCFLQFTDGDREAVLAVLRGEWSNAELKENSATAQETIEKIFESLIKGGSSRLTLSLKGTPFQLKVWNALLNIPFGTVVSYSELARLSGNPKAVRAAASAIAANPVGYIIPCHRVIRAEGVVGQYHWRPNRKAAIIGWEKAAAINRNNLQPPYNRDEDE